MEFLKRISLVPCRSQKTPHLFAGVSIHLCSSGGAEEPPDLLILFQKLEHLERLDVALSCASFARNELMKTTLLGWYMQAAVTHVSLSVTVEQPWPGTLSLLNVDDMGEEEEDEGVEEEGPVGAVAVLQECLMNLQGALRPYKLKVGKLHACFG